MWVIILLKRFAFALAILFIIPFNAYGADCSAVSAIVIDADTGNILYEKNAYAERSMASTTKIMTALLAIESDRLDEQVKISSEMIRTEGSALGLKPDDTITLYDLVVGMMLTSGNDSANAVAHILCGGIKEFAELMNKRAAQIGMNSTLFVTPSGLDEGGHHSTAYDMALLTRCAIENEVFCKIVSMKSAVIVINGKEQTVYNHNKLLSKNDNYFGVKTGYTMKAGRCLVSAKKYNGNRLICVTLSAPDDWNDHILLYKQCEKAYNEYTVGDNIMLNAVGGVKDTVSCSYNKKFYVLSDLKIEVYHYPFIYAPVKMGDKVGEVLVTYNENIVERLPIEADEDVEYAKQERCTTSKVYG